MKYTEQEIETIAKSIYKAVKKALGVAVTADAKEKSRVKNNKDALDDLMDPNFIAEAKEKTPPERTSQMNKTEKGVIKLRNFIKNKQK